MAHRNNLHRRSTDAAWRHWLRLGAFCCVLMSAGTLGYSQLKGSIDGVVARMADQERLQLDAQRRQDTSNLEFSNRLDGIATAIEGLHPDPVLRPARKPRPHLAFSHGVRFDD